jgi:hypothetical protein
MCVDKLIGKLKLLCPTSGTDIRVVFSLMGMSPTPVKFVAVLLKTTGTYTLELRDGSNTLLSTLQGQGTGAFDFALFKNIELPYPSIVQLHITSLDTLHLYEVNTADICLCGPEDCI